MEETKVKEGEVGLHSMSMPLHNTSVPTSFSSPGAGASSYMQQMHQQQQHFNIQNQGQSHGTMGMTHGFGPPPPSAVYASLGPKQQQQHSNVNVNVSQSLSGANTWPLPPPSQNFTSQIPSPNYSSNINIPPPSPQQMQNYVSNLPPRSPQQNFVSNLPPPSPQQNYVSNLPPPSPKQNYVSNLPPPSPQQNYVSNLPPPSPQQNYVSNLPPPSPQQNYVSILPPPSPQQTQNFITTNLSSPSPQQNVQNLNYTTNLPPPSPQQNFINLPPPSPQQNIQTFTTNLPPRSPSIQTYTNLPPKSPSMQNFTTNLPPRSPSMQNFTANLPPRSPSMQQMQNFTNHPPRSPSMQQIQNFTGLPPRSPSMQNFVNMPARSPSMQMQNFSNVPPGSPSMQNFTGNMNMNLPPRSPSVQNYVPQPHEQMQVQNTITVAAVSAPNPIPTTTAASSSGELQNELLKQLLQNTGCASMSQVLSEASSFTLLNTKQPTTMMSIPLRTPHLSEAATRIPQPTQRPTSFENSSSSMMQPQVQVQQQLSQQLHQQHQQPVVVQQMQQQQQSTQLQQQQLPQLQQQQPHLNQLLGPTSTPSPSQAAAPPPTFRHPPQVFDWNSNAPKPQSLTLPGPRLSADVPGSRSSTPGTPGPAPPTPGSVIIMDSKLNIKMETEFSSSNVNLNINVRGPENNVTGTGIGTLTPDVTGQGVTAVEHKPMLDMAVFSSLPSSTSPGSATAKKAMDDEAKKAKRRQYQAKRRQSQIKEQQLQQQQAQQQPPNPQQQQPQVQTSTPKKRARKASKIETETYDSFIENLMTQLRRLPPVGVVEPEIERNYSICECFGQSDLSNLRFKNTGSGAVGAASTFVDVDVGDLEGELGCSALTHRLDYYNAQSPGEDHPVRLPQQQIQRGFYHQEFACPRIVLPGDKSVRTPTPVRDTDTPDTIVSSSSPELDTKPDLYPGFKIIDPNEDPEDAAKYLRESPDLNFRIIRNPIAIRPNLMNGSGQIDKENRCMEIVPKPPNRFGFGSAHRNNGNVSVTLTLSSSAADDIGVVLRDLANVLSLTSPAAATAAAAALQQKSEQMQLFKNKEGKEKEFDEIQSILNGATKFCRHCDVIILNNIIKKSASDFPGVAVSPSDSLDSPNEFYFCGSSCYVQFSMSQGLNTGSEIEDKAGSVVNHPSESKQQQRKRGPSGSVPTSGSGMELVLYGGSPGSGSIPPEGQVGEDEPPKKKWKGIRYKYWTPNTKPEQKYKKPSEKEMTEMLFRLGSTVLPSHLPEDTRKCVFCQISGDGISNGPARLLNVDVDKWVHLNCALWSKEVYETENGGLVNIDAALKQSLVLTCVLCKQKGATVKCFKIRCSSVYHLGCAVKEGCVFYKNKAVYCAVHISKEEKGNELTTLKVNRRVYIQRDENRQVGAVLHNAHADQQNYMLRVGSLILLNIGQLLPHQLAAFHSRNYIYPIGYKVVRFYWSMRRLKKRCQYICSIHEVEGKPEFRIMPQEEAGVVACSSKDAQQCFKSETARGAWLQVVEQVARLRAAANGIKVFTKYISGEDLFGLIEPIIVRVLESLPGVETLTDYHFKYGRNPLLELPLAINPTGCARSEPKLRTHFKRPHGTQRTTGSFASSSSSASTSASYLSDFGLACPYSKQFVHSKSSQYKKMKQDWRNNIYLARSKIQGLGLYAARDIEKHTMVIEYIGEIIRKKLADRRENRYEAQNRGIYMFRIDDDRVIDATLCGGLARYVNHSCNPNCVTETVEVDRDLKIIIFANRRISRGEELSYDYKFEFEDAQHKIPCLCGASSCRQWMN